MKVFLIALLGLLANVASAIELTASNYDFETEGKTTLIKFFAPWCGHCKKMKPDWDKLMEEFADSRTQLVAEVDCTSDGGKPICEANGVKGYPTLKWGDPAALEDYSGGRDLKTLSEFSHENLKPRCSPTHMELCDAKKQKEIKKYMDLSVSDVEAKIKSEEDKVAKVEADHKTFVEGLQKKFKDATDTKDEKISKIKASGLGLLKQVLISKQKKSHDEL